VRSTFKDFNRKEREVSRRIEESLGRLRGCLSERAGERASPVTGGDAILEEAASAERQADSLHISAHPRNQIGFFQEIAPAVVSIFFALAQDDPDCA